MKSSLVKLRKFALYKTDAKEKRENQPLALSDELAQASKDMQDIRNCYDSLLSAAAATANSAYELSESLREMGSGLLEKSSLNDDEESGKILLKLGKVQFELQKLLDSYRSHIFQTITTPSESLLNELRTVEEMKRQCDEKREVYEYMVAQQKEKGRSKSAKRDNFTLDQLKTAHDEYDEEATLCVFRLKSLKQGQYRSLLTQAARHHAAQLNFFRKGLKSLEAVEPQVRMITEQLHIDYHFNGLEDDGDDGEDDGENGYEYNPDGELSFDYGQGKHVSEAVSTSRNSMELDQVDVSFRPSKIESMEVNLDKSQGDTLLFGREARVSGIQSAPILPERKFDPAERIKQLQPSATRKSYTYVLPTPSKISTPSRTSTSVPRSRPGINDHSPNPWHSSPLEQKKTGKDSRDDNLSLQLNASKSQSVLKESNSNIALTRIPPPLPEGLSLSASETKKVKRQAFSDELTSKPWSTKPISSASGPLASTSEPPRLLVPGLLTQGPVPQTLSPPKLSPSASPPPVSSPKISELHELPRPPSGFPIKPGRSSAFVGHSAPLGLRYQEFSAANKISQLNSAHAASPLPIPPVNRSRSLHVTEPLERSRIRKEGSEVPSPPLTPISLTNMKTISTASEVAPQPGRSRGGTDFMRI